MKILLLGKNGQLGWELQRSLALLGELVAVGKDFYGVFSTSNQPRKANFPQGVQYQRNANFTTNTLLDVDNATPVHVSIDPFFFKVSG